LLRTHLPALRPARAWPCLTPCTRLPHCRPLCCSPVPCYWVLDMCLYFVYALHATAVRTPACLPAYFCTARLQTGLRALPAAVLPRHHHGLGSMSRAHVAPHRCCPPPVLPAFTITRRARPLPPLPPYPTPRQGRSRFPSPFAAVNIYPHAPHITHTRIRLAFSLFPPPLTPPSAPHRVVYISAHNAAFRFPCRLQHAPSHTCCSWSLFT